MFKKLLSNLPFNPSLISQVGFYSKRLRQENFVRGVGVSAMVLALFIQTFAVISPPQHSLAEGPNDIVKGGFSTRSEAVRLCNNDREFGIILAYYGVSCDQLADTKATVTRNIKSTAYNKQLDSLGRTSQPKYNPKNSNPSDQYDVDIPNMSETLYMKNLWYWDTNSSSTYKVLQTKNVKGDTIFILYSCANIATVGEYEPEEEKTDIPTPDKPAPEKPTYEPGTVFCDGFTKALIADRTYKFTAGIKGERFKTAAYAFDFGDGSTYEVTSTQKSLSKLYTYKDAGKYKISVNISADVLTKDGSYAPKSVSCYTSVTTQEDKPEIVDVCDNIMGNQTDINECYPCPEAENEGVEACLTFDKTAKNESLGIADAHATTAKAGNIIIYTLSVNNKGNKVFKDFKFAENLADVLEYADINDYAGGKLNNRKQLTWALRDIPANETASLTFSVKIKDKIPTTPRSSSDLGSYDMCIVNVFWDQSVTICIDPPLNKRIEIVADTLPNTGPGESIAITFTIVTLMGYFFARNRLMSEEIELVRDEFTGGKA